MPLRLENDIAWLEGRCTPEEAEPLLDCLRASPKPTVDLGACEEFHSAILMVLLAARPVITSMPTNPFLVDCLSAISVPAEMHDSSPTRTVNSGDRNDPGV